MYKGYERCKGVQMCTRFQENEGVQKSIQNAIRYHADKDFKSQYHADLGEFCSGTLK